MGFYVHIHVAFNANDDDMVRRVAARHRARTNERTSIDAMAFLKALSEGECSHTGPKGTLCTWGHIGNYTNGSAFVELLRPFWRDLYREEKDEGGDLEEPVLSSQRIMVFTEAEQSGCAQGWQISLEGDEIEVKHIEELPFSWGM